MRVLLACLVIAAAAVAAAQQAPPVVIPPAAGPVTVTNSKLPGNPWRPVRRASATSPALSAEDELKTFSLPPGYHAQLVAKEPLIQEPIAIDFDADGRLWALEMPGFMPDTSGRDSRDPINRVVVLEDTNGDGVMDKRTVFCEGLVLPRALKVLDRGVLVGEPPNLWLMKDTNGDLKADTKDLLINSFGNANGNIEHNANSLLWAMDNWIYTSEHDWFLRLRGGRFETRPTVSRGQWGASQDDAGRVFRNVNDEPLYVDFTPGQYFTRNPNVVRTRGLYELLIEQMDATIYPVRPTRGVNRGYREQFVRADGSSIIIQGAGTPVIYRGDRLPKELQGNAFITDSPTNLVHRLVLVDDGSGRLTARNGYARGEILASSDERFRPVTLASAPDGTLYVVDMYRGVVQDGAFWTDYLREYIKSHDLELPVGKGRIWRIVHDSTRLDRRPALSSATPAQLVQTLSHPNGWWRDMAQQLLVERGDSSVAPALKQLAATAPGWRTRLHALWTLDGLDAIDTATVEKALGDLSPDVRAAGVRISERWLGQPDQPITASVLKLAGDRSWTVRRQLAASIGELPPAARIEPAAAVLTKDGADPIIVDTALSGLRGQEADVLDRVLQASALQPQRDAVTMLAAAVAKSSDAARVQRIIDFAARADHADWRTQALLQGLDTGLPAPGAGGRGGRGGGGGLPGIGGGGSGRISVAPGRGVTLSSQPAGLVALSAAADPIGGLAKSVLSKLDWAGKPAPAGPVVAPLSADEQKRFEAGKEIFVAICAGCHQADGQGKEKVAPSLVTSKYVQAAPQLPMRIVLGGKEGPVGLMPPLGAALTDQQIASVLTYIRREWGHTASPVNPTDVTELRQTTTSHKMPWTEDELSRMVTGGRGRGGN